MKRQLIRPDPELFPDSLRPLISGAAVYDSSCSPDAKVYFIDQDRGFYLKTAPKGTLRTEADMTRFFHGKHLSAEVLAYVSDTQDWLLTARIPGEDCLPNILLDHWQFSGFIDLAAGGVGDRHIDLFWGIWSLSFNLKTDRYRDRFLDTYDRADVEEDLLRLVAAIEVFR